VPAEPCKVTSAGRGVEAAAYHVPVTLADLRTPAVLVERPRLDTNIRRMQAAASGAGIALRPHAKTHKSPLVAQRQIEAGAIGICCAKLGEAEVFAEAGIADIRVPYPLQPSNAGRVLALQRTTRLSFIVDHMGVARGWSEAMAAAGTRATVLVKVDVGFHRCGIAPDPATAVPFLREVAACRACTLPASSATPATPTTRIRTTNSAGWPRPSAT
jgi:3-hydroxy-D-aspartate aldolase